ARSGQFDRMGAEAGLAQSRRSDHSGSRESKYLFVVARGNESQKFGKDGFAVKTNARISRLLMTMCLLAASAVVLMAQGTYRAQICGVIEDVNGACVRVA